MLGVDEEMTWKQEDDALIIKKPAHWPDWQVLGFRILYQ